MNADYILKQISKGIVSIDEIKHSILPYCKYSDDASKKLSQFNSRFNVKVYLLPVDITVQKYLIDGISNIMYIFAGESTL